MILLTFDISWNLIFWRSISFKLNISESDIFENMIWIGILYRINDKEYISEDRRILNVSRIDVGGTTTDAVLIRNGKVCSTAKVSTEPGNLLNALLET